MRIGNREIGPDKPCYIIAEVSCNHEGDIDEAKRIIEAAAAAGCDAAKIQTYTADTVTRNFKNKAKNTIWDKTDLYALYQKAHTPWDWHSELLKTATDCGVHLFSSPFDETAVDFLETQNVPVYKVASFEIVDTKLLEKIAKTGKPVIMSTGMADFLEIQEAYETLRKNGAKDIAILHCNSGYPGDFAEANLLTIPAMKKLFGVVVGLSDHIIFSDSDIKKCKIPLAHVTPLEAVKLGAKIIEVHLTMDRDKGRALMKKNKGGYDWAFSRTPEEMRKITSFIHQWEAGKSPQYETSLEREMAAKAMGHICFEPTPKELGSRKLRPSLWVTEDIEEGQPLKFCGGKPGNFDSIRPGGGLHIRYADFIHGKKASRQLIAGQPLSWDMIKAQDM